MTDTRDTDWKTVEEYAVGQGLPGDCSPEDILRHVLGNKNLTIACQALVIDTYEDRWATVERHLSEVWAMAARADAAFSHEDHDAEVHELNAIKRWATSFKRWAEDTVKP